MNKFPNYFSNQVYFLNRGQIYEPTFGEAVNKGLNYGVLTRVTPSPNNHNIANFTLGRKKVPKVRLDFFPGAGAHVTITVYTIYCKVYSTCEMWMWVELKSYFLLTLPYLYGERVGTRMLCKVTLPEILILASDLKASLSTFPKC